jgi:hypothetical protein
VLKLCTLLIPALAIAADPFYLGTWKIASAVEAPWADAAHKDDPAEMKTLVGKIVIFKPGEIIGPRQVACQGPKYTVKDYPADMLFQERSGKCKAAINRSIRKNWRPSWASKASHGRR